MSNRIPNFGWNRLKLATLTYEQLAELEEQVKAEHACKNGIHLFDKAGQRKLDALSWAVYNKQKAERAACARRWIFEPVIGSKQFTHSFSYALTISNGTEMYSLMKGGLVVAERHLSQLIAVMETRPFTQLMQKGKESLRFCLSLRCLESGSAGLSTPATSLTLRGKREKAGRPIW